MPWPGNARIATIGMEPETGVVHVAGKSEADFVRPSSSYRISKTAGDFEVPEFGFRSRPDAVRLSNTLKFYSHEN